MKRIVAIIIVALTLLCQTVYGEGIEPYEDGERKIIYVAPNGNDTAEGTMEKPLKTLKGARDKIRVLKKTGVSAPKGYVVYFRGGNYFCSEGVTFSQEDSGTPEAPIVYRSYPGEEAKFYGGVMVSGRDLAKVTDQSVTDRIITTTARDKIYMYDLKKLGVKDVGPAYLKGVYSYKMISEQGSLIGTGKAPKAPAMEVFVDGEAYHLAQYPNGSGTITIDTVVDEGFNWYNDLTTNKGWGNPFTIRITDQRMKYWTHLDPADIIMYGKWKFEWADSSIPMRSFNATTGEIVSDGSYVHGVAAGRGFIVYNLLEELDEAGEYYIDPNTSILYCYEPKNLANAEILLTLLEEPIVTVDDCSNLQFKYLTIQGARVAAFDIGKKAKSIELSNMDISFTDSKALTIYGMNNGIRNSVIHDINTGINLYGGEPSTLTRGECYVENCEIYNIGRVTRTYAGAINVGGFGNHVRHNKIHGAPHVGVQFSGFDWTIAYNEIYDVVQEADDMAAIYGGISLSQRGGQIKYNYIHDVRTSSPAYSYGIYIDDRGSDIVVMGNVIEETKTAMNVNGGSYIYISNNIFINNSGGLQMTELADSTLNRQYASLEDQPFTKSEAFKAHYPHFAEMMGPDHLVKDRSYLLPHHDVYANNILLNTPLALYNNNAGDYIDDAHNYQTSKDPGFVDMAEKNYMLKKDSIAFTKLPEFKPLPFTRMGMLNDLADVRVQDSICLAVDNPYSLVQGKSTPIDPDNVNVVPMIMNERTFVPLRFVAETLGLNVSFNEETGEITIAGGEVLLSLHAGDTQAKKNGEAITMENAPFIDEGRTLVPLREISNLFGKQVFWYDMGFIVISDDEAIFVPEDSTEQTMIRYLYNKINIY